MENKKIKYSADNPWFANATVALEGIIIITFDPHIKIEIAMNRAVRMVNYQSYIKMALSGSGNISALTLPRGYQVIQSENTVDVLVQGYNYENKKYAKIDENITFKSDITNEIYMIDNNGVRSVVDTFLFYRENISLDVFYSEQCRFLNNVEKATEVLKTLEFWLSNDNTQHWVLNGIHIFYFQDGSVRINRNENTISLRTSPSNDFASINSSHMSCSAHMKDDTQLSVRCQDRSVHYDGYSFTVIHGTQRAILTYNNELQII